MVELIHISFNKVYRYKHVTFEWHRFCGPLFVRMKDLEPKSQQLRPMRDYKVINQWANMPDEDKEKYLVG